MAAEANHETDRRRSAKSWPADPFHHLQSDGLWIVDAKGEPGASPVRLRSSNATGQLVPDLEAALDADPGLAMAIGQAVLDANFAPSLHEDIAAATGLDLDTSRPSSPLSGRRRRDPGFRDAVLVAYEYRCAFCGYDGRLRVQAIGLEAAHLRWSAFDGLDQVDNALCLCSIHHKLLDHGALGVTRDHRVAVSARFVGHSSSAHAMVLALSGQSIIPPQPTFRPPASEHVDWHSSQVFRGPARPRVLHQGRETR